MNLIYFFLQAFNLTQAIYDVKHSFISTVYGKKNTTFAAPRIFKSFSSFFLGTESRQPRLTGWVNKYSM